ncbi:hypothetical protein GW17_00045323 [Ensete ventricosum]|nr:hypothetical protein GW17_00045323 [Ensete ventricosum]RZR92883.1 hypothetical protein BHM03_00021258 [Ensete ventricosum]
MVSERVVTVEYLEPTMSRELLGKFPDNSAFDFDYSQSGIWSPLLPRGGGIGRHGPASLLLDGARKKLLAGSPVTLRRVKAKLTFKKKKKKQKRPSALRKSLDFSPVPSPKLVMLHPRGVEEGAESGREALQGPCKIAAADDAAHIMTHPRNSGLLNWCIRSPPHLL